MDKQRFTDLKSLADVLGLSPNDALEIDKKAQAEMKIGNKTWYDWDKALDFVKSQNALKIKWYGIDTAKSGRVVRDTDVSISIDKNDKLRISFKLNVLKGVKLNRVLIGTYENRMYFKFGSEGYAMALKEKSVTSTSLKCRDGLRDFVGSYVHLHKDGELFYIEREVDNNDE
jgi:hypothetical protein